MVTCRGKGDECDKQGPAVRFLAADIVLLFLTQAVKIIEIRCLIIFTQCLIYNYSLDCMDFLFYFGTKPLLKLYCVCIMLDTLRTPPCDSYQTLDFAYKSFFTIGKLF